MSPACGIGHLRVVGGGVNEGESSKEQFACNSVTRRTAGGAVGIGQMLEAAVQGWKEQGSAGELRRRLLRVLLAIDE